MAAAPLGEQQQEQQQAAGHPQQPGTAAQLALGCVCASLQLLVQVRRGGGAAADQLASCCLQTLQRCAAAAAAVAAAAAGQPVVPGATSGEWQRAVATLQPLAGCCDALAAAMGAGWLSGLEQHQTLAAAAEASETALDAVLVLQAAAAGAAAATGTCKQAGGPAAYHHRLCWRAIAGLLALRQQLQLAQQREGWPEQQAAAFAAALSGLQQAAHAPALAADHRGLLLQLRCCRLLLPTALQQHQVGQLALARRQQVPAAATQAGQVSSSPAAALAGWVCSAAWQAYEAAAVAAKRRRVGLTAAVASTCLHPALFADAPVASSGVAALAAAAAVHGPGSPLQRLVGQLLEVGAKSWRTMSIVSLQASGL